MANICNKVIIWGADNFNTLGLLRQLGNSNLDIIFLIKGNVGIATKSKYCTSYITTANLEEGYNYLLNNYCDSINKAIIITSGDDIITYIDQHRKELVPFFILPGTTQAGLIEKYIDKNSMTDLAMSLGILCPLSKLICWNSPLDDISYPCLLKPSREKPGYFNEFKSKICFNEAFLVKTLKYVRHDTEFILQQYIPKKEEVLIYGGRMRDGRTIIAGAFIKDRLLKSGPGAHGILTRDMPVSVDVEKISKFLDYIDYYGPFSFEYGLYDERAYFFEVNLRNDGTSHYFYQAGANIPLAYVYSCAGLDYRHIDTRVSCNRWYIDEIYGIENVLTRNVSLKQWRKELKEATVFRFYDRNDIRPWKAEKKNRWMKILRGLIISKFRIYIVYFGDRFGLRK